MKRLFLLAAGVLLFAGGLRADDQLRDVQTELKTQGFYFGEADGRDTPELKAAIRRYQIRNGLEATGEVNAEVLGSLGIGAPPPAAPAPAPQPEEEPAATVPPPPRAAPSREPDSRGPVDLRREETVEESDRRVLRQETTRRPRDPSVVPPPAALDGPVRNQPDPAYRDVFAGTPYRIAPQQVQVDTLRRAQQILAERGHYRSVVDGMPGPATEEAILSYQRSSRLPLSGRLDLETLNALRLLPGRGPGNPPIKPFNSPGRGARPGSSVRGMWIE